MNTLRSTLQRILNLFRRPHLERKLDTELSSHLEHHIDDNLRRGLSPGEARRAALLQLGGLEQTKERIRDQRTLPALDSLFQDLRFAARLLRKSPAFTLVVVLTVALGIAANATIFAMVSRFVLHTAPVGDPATVLSLYTTEHNTCCNNFSWPLYTDIRDNSYSLSGVAGFYELLPASISGHGDPQRLWGQATTTNFFDVTRLAVTLGRGFRSDELNSRVVVLGHRFWRSRFDSDPAIIGESVTLSGHPYTVVGVAPSTFRGVDLVLDAQFWVPIGISTSSSPTLVAPTTAIITGSVLPLASSPAFLVPKPPPNSLSSPSVSPRPILPPTKTSASISSKLALSRHAIKP